MQSKIYLKFILSNLLIFCTYYLSAQSLADGVFMPKSGICGGVMYSYDSWVDYWEGTFKRENLNLGRVSTQSMQVMATYGITEKLNVVVGLPYIWTKASAGTLAGQNGIQDLMGGLKYQLLTVNSEAHNLALSAAVGGSIPLGHYTPDLLPLSIGFQSKTAFGRAIAAYSFQNNWNLTAQATYTTRGKVTLDRESYFTTYLINSKEVAMPDVFSYSVKVGFNNKKWSAEAFFEQMNTLGGFDIRRNDMPFVSNNMDMSRVGIMGFYTIPQLADLQIVGAFRYTLAGRNVGQSAGFSIGLMKAFSLQKSQSTTN